ncbi:hypothetical protein TSOC_010219 [Tetrabaena socialis]|uniref:Uncharacterized protein n=1 Tax=Tetrabaena socialis TaxID=47790 RepID=A0A2J7ZTT4_9CHLO|nr:hypothetical protein TSOC_010219 [Tetrabaena socialis]|eukprot:PNH03686.1 hypothetical protein TSOC_010219 [Tetrabaena socialis]
MYFKPPVARAGKTTARLVQCFLQGICTEEERVSGEAIHSNARATGKETARLVQCFQHGTGTEEERARGEAIHSSKRSGGRTGGARGGKESARLLQCFLQGTGTEEERVRGEAIHKGRRAGGPRTGTENARLVQCFQQGTGTEEERARGEALLQAGRAAGRKKAAAGPSAVYDEPTMLDFLRPHFVKGVATKRARIDGGWGLDRKAILGSPDLLQQLEGMLAKSSGDGGKPVSAFAFLAGEPKDRLLRLLRQEKGLPD